MNLLLNNLSLRLTRSIESKVLGILVANGYAVDRSQYLNNPAGYAAKQTDIKNRKGFCIEVFGHGASHDRDSKLIPRMVINSFGFTGGSLGNDLIEYFKENATGTFDKLQGPSRSSNFRFEIELISNKTYQDVVMESVRAMALPNLSYIPLVEGSEDESFLIQYTSPRSLPDVGGGLIQRTYGYEVLDVFETLPTLISSEVARIKRITVKDPTGQTIVKTGPILWADEDPWDDLLTWEE